MGLIVQKFGGSSVANAERVNNVARIVTDTYKAGNDVVVVVSAQGDTTDDLIEKAHKTSGAETAPLGPHSIRARVADNGKSAEKGEDSFAPKGHGKERYRREPEGESTGRVLSV
jgi:aspartokinase